MTDTPTAAPASATTTTTSISSPVLSTATSSTAVESGSNALKDDTTTPKETPPPAKLPDPLHLTPQSTTSISGSSTVPDTTTATDSAKRTEEARTAFLASLQAIGSSADAGLQARATDITANHAVLSKQQEGLDEAAAALAKETRKYQKLADETRDKLKDVGDVQNFAEVIERELMVLEETLRIVEEEGEEEGDNEGKGAKGKRKKWWF